LLLIEGFAYRELLAEIISRWTVNRPQPGDVLLLKRLVNFNFYASRLWIDHLARSLLREQHGAEPEWTRIRTKGELKDFAVAHPTYRDERIDELLARYRRWPEDFYRETPIDGGFYTIEGAGGPLLVGSTRVKRSRRIAEKGARRMVDFIHARIRTSAEDLARERAQRMGVPFERLHTSQAEMVDEYLHAERRVIKSVKQGTILGALAPLSIPDVAGIKLIVEDKDRERITSLLGNLEDCRIVEEEIHRGDYNATNLRVVHRLPKELLWSHPPSGFAAEVLAQRGLPRDTMAADWRAFVDGAEPEVGVEVIASNFREFLESEIGRCIHEERVLSMRVQPSYTGHLATNVRYLMDFLFTLCRGPALPDLDQVPIKLWVRYMPETIERIRGELLLPHVLTLDSTDLVAEGG
jgi:hypothetical protein